MVRDGVRYTTIAALLIAPVAASLCASVGTLALMSFAANGAPTWDDAVGPLLLIFTLSTCIALPVTLTLGAYVHIRFQRSGQRSLRAYLLASLGAAVVTTVAISIWLSPNYGYVGLWLGLWAIPVGLLTALFAWLIRRPDRDAPNPPTSTS